VQAVLYSITAVIVKYLEEVFDLVDRCILLS